jgi:hypothetical protein
METTTNGGNEMTATTTSHGFTYDVHSDEAATEFFNFLRRAGVEEARIARMMGTREEFLKEAK